MGADIMPRDIASDTYESVKYGAIEAAHPVYKGIEFDSALEMNLARAFDEREIAWRYHPQTFHDPNFIFGYQYTPDFYLPHFKIYVESCSIWDTRHEHVCMYFNANYAPICTIDQQGFVSDWMGRRNGLILGIDSLLPYNPHSDYKTLFEQGIKRKKERPCDIEALQYQVNNQSATLDAICRISRRKDVQASLRETEHCMIVCTKCASTYKRKFVYYAKSGTIQCFPTLNGIDDLLALLDCDSDAEISALIEQRG